MDTQFVHAFFMDEFKEYSVKISFKNLSLSILSRYRSIPASLKVRFYERALFLIYFTNSFG